MSIKSANFDILLIWFYLTQFEKRSYFFSQRKQRIVKSSKPFLCALELCIRFYVEKFQKATIESIVRTHQNSVANVLCCYYKNQYTTFLPKLKQQMLSHFFSDTLYNIFNLTTPLSLTDINFWYSAWHNILIYLLYIFRFSGWAYFIHFTKIHFNLRICLLHCCSSSSSIWIIFFC